MVVALRVLRPRPLAARHMQQQLLKLPASCMPVYALVVLAYALVVLAYRKQTTADSCRGRAIEFCLESLAVEWERRLQDRTRLTCP